MHSTGDPRCEIGPRDVHCRAHATASARALRALHANRRAKRQRGIAAGEQSARICWLGDLIARDRVLAVPRMRWWRREPTITTSIKSWSATHAGIPAGPPPPHPASAAAADGPPPSAVQAGRPPHGPIGGPPHATSGVQAAAVRPARPAARPAAFAPGPPPHGPMARPIRPLSMAPWPAARRSAIHLPRPRFQPRPCPSVRLSERLGLPAMGRRRDPAAAVPGAGLLLSRLGRARPGAAAARRAMGALRTGFALGRRQHRPSPRRRLRRVLRGLIPPRSGCVA